jgi:hypothetical protein
LSYFPSKNTLKKRTKKTIAHEIKKYENLAKITAKDSSLKTRIQNMDRIHKIIARTKYEKSLT